MKNKLIIISILLIGIVTGGVLFSNTASTAQKTRDGGVYAPSFEQEIFNKTNNLRASKGLPVLKTNSVLKSKARGWAMQLNINDDPSHSDVPEGNTEPWIIVGENVGFTHNAQEAFDMLVASPSHYANLVDPRFTHMEVGGVEIMGSYYFAQEFMQLPVEETTTTQAPIATTTPKKSATVCK